MENRPNRARALAIMAGEKLPSRDDLAVNALGQAPDEFDERGWQDLVEPVIAIPSPAATPATEVVCVINMRHDGAPWITLPNGQAFNLWDHCGPAVLYRHEQVVASLKARIALLEAQLARHRLEAH